MALVSNLQTPYTTYTNKTPNPTRVFGIYANYKGHCFDRIISAGTTVTASQTGECLPKTITADMGLAPSDFPCESFDTSGSDSSNYSIIMRKDGTWYVTN